MIFARRSRCVGGLGILAMLLCACGGGGGGGSAIPATAQGKTVTAWAAAMANDLAMTGSNQTFRVIFKPTVSGKRVSVHFSNVLGTAPVTIGAATIGIVSSGAAQTTSVPLTFGGKSSVTIAAGASISSDQASLTYAFGSLLAVTEYLSGSWTSLPQNDSNGLRTNYTTASGAGNATSDSAGTAFTQTTNETFLVDRLDVTGAYKETVAFIGSSTTAGFGSTPNGYNDLVDDIATNLHAAGNDTIGLANVAIIPDSLLTANEIVNNPSAIARFSRDVVSLPNVAIVVQNAADIDLKDDCDSAQDVIAGDQQLVAMAHSAGIKIYLAVIAPSTYCPTQEPAGYGTRFAANTGEDAQRVLLNNWIRSTAPSTVNGVAEAAPGADAVVDISTPITDPTDTGYMLPAYDYGDDSHANAAGQALQAAQFPASMF